MLLRFRRIGQMGIMSEKENQIVVYQPNETVRLDVRLENETVWLNQSRLGDLFGVDRTVINRHIHNIYITGELDIDSTCAKIAQVQNEGGRSITPKLPNSPKRKQSFYKCCNNKEKDSRLKW